MKRPLTSALFSDFELERYRLGELSETRMTVLKHRLIEDEELQGRLKKLESSDQELLERHPARLTVAGIRGRLEGHTHQPPPMRNPLRIRLWVAPALLTAAILVVVILPRAPLVQESPRVAESEEDSIRIKGLQPELVLFRKTAAGSEHLHDGANAIDGDLIRIGYQAAGRPYGVIVSLDGRGVVTLHYPRQGKHADQLDSGMVLLNFAYELDDAPAFERFYFVTSDRPFEVSVVLQAVQSLGSEPNSDHSKLALHKDLNQHVFSLLKGRQQ
ncbi:MAG: ActD-like protein [bacterium]|nr:ActD-like protein [bacterium]